jgi:CMP-N,N'-diacetyllegionaminic acid synthase
MSNDDHKGGKNVALLTGRGGSVSIKDKNVMPVLGRPLMLYPFLAALHANLIDEIYLTTDGEKLKEVARTHGIAVIDRPPEISRPTSQHAECIAHALDYLSHQGISVNILVVLLCNVATHETGAIDSAIRFLMAHPEFDSCVSISEMQENHPAIAKKAVDHPTALVRPPNCAVHYLRPFQDDEQAISRERMRPCYFLTHSFWALKVGGGLRRGGQPPWDFMGERVAGLIMDNGRDIHDVEDSAFAECWLQMRGWTPLQDPHPAGVSGLVGAQ